MSAAASLLRAEGYEVIELAVDRLPIESPEGLSKELGLTYSVLEVLGTGPATNLPFSLSTPLMPRAAALTRRSFAA
jgi:hypothetical protein